MGSAPSQRPARRVRRLLILSAASGAGARVWRSRGRVGAWNRDRGCKRPNAARFHCAQVRAHCREFRCRERRIDTGARESRYDAATASDSRRARDGVLPRHASTMARQQLYSDHSIRRFVTQMHSCAADLRRVATGTHTMLNGLLSRFKREGRPRFSGSRWLVGGQAQLATNWSLPDVAPVLAPPLQ